MTGLQETRIYCPYCGEPIVVLLNPEDCGDVYIEDCQVCCRPIELRPFEESDGSLSVTVSSDTEVL